MGRGRKRLGPQEYIRAWLTADELELVEASLKEASRLVGELDEWKKTQVKYDPQGMAWVWEDELFGLVDKAVRYRYRIYNANKKMRELEFELIQIRITQYDDELSVAFSSDARVKEIKETMNDLETDQMMFFWKIKKIHTRVCREFKPSLATGEDDPFAEYEYDPATS